MKTILLIESDDAFAQPLAASLRERGFGVEVTVDGQEGIDLARAGPPAAIVLAVELPRTSGYVICNKLKKDDQLRAIPLVITSAAGSEETFDQHRKLKTRAEEYLLKPFAPEALIEKLGALVGMPEPEAASEPGAQVDVVTLDDVEEFESTIAALDAAARTDAEPPPVEEDPDLSAFDKAFESVAAGPELSAFAIPPAIATPPTPTQVPAPAPPAVAVPAPIAPAPAAPPARAAPPSPPPPAAPRQRDGDPGEAARLQDRISELRLEAARVAEERERLAARLAVAERERDEARARASELEAIVAKHEARVVKAYERLKGDEAVKEKTRRALAIALQLLEEGAAPPKTREG